MIPHDTCTRTGLRSRQICRLAMAAALLLYVVSWFLSPLRADPPSEDSDRTFTAQFVFRYTMMMLRIPPTGSMDWFTWKLMGLTGATNFVVPLVVVSLLLDRFWFSVGVLFLASGLLDLLWMYWLPLDGRSGLGVGYFLWLSSFWLFAMACLASAYVKTRPHPDKARPDTTQQPTGAPSDAGN